VSALTKSDRAVTLRWVAALGVGLAAFAVYVFAATPTPYALDSAELASAAFGLGVAHPPGEETALLFTKLVMLLPLGGVAFKAALAQALAGAVAAVLVFLLVLEVAESLPWVADGTGEDARLAVAAAAALAFAYAPGVVMVSNRAEVYAVQTALSLAALRLALRAHATGDARSALLAALLIGLGIGNHALVAGLVGLGAVVAAVPVLSRSSTRGRLVGLAVLAFAVGLLVHAYLPLRTSALFAAADRGVDNVLWGDARTPGGFWWLVSAKTFTEKTAVVHGNASPWDLPFLPIEELDKLFALLAPAGAYFMLRRPNTRMAGVATLVGIAGSMAAALIGGLDPANPDIRGYLGPAIGLIAVLSGVTLAVGLAVFQARKVRAVLVLVFLAGALSRAPTTGYPSLRYAGAVDEEARSTLFALPARAALFTFHFETGFLVGYQRLVEGLRPDVAWAHLAFVGDRGYAGRLRMAQPELGGVLGAYRDHSGLAQAFVDLDRSRPVRIEPDVATPVEVRRTLGPAGDGWAPAADTSPEGVRPVEDWAVAEAKQDRQVRGFLAWRHFIDAVWSCELGFYERAQERFRELERLVPNDARFRELQARCR
jgi:hypothetical protein